GKENETSDEPSLYSKHNRIRHQERKKLETAKSAVNVCQKLVNICEKKEDAF
ncbi:12166_t:CDS:1, partial [Cetraspora pellucida]